LTSKFQAPHLIEKNHLACCGRACDRSMGKVDRIFQKVKLSDWNTWRIELSEQSFFVSFDIVHLIADRIAAIKDARADDPTDPESALLECLCKPLCQARLTGTDLAVDNNAPVFAPFNQLDDKGGNRGERVFDFIHVAFRLAASGQRNKRAPLTNGGALGESSTLLA